METSQAPSGLPLAHPARFRIVEREGNTWAIHRLGEAIYSPSGQSAQDPNDLEAMFGLKPSTVCIELFRINGGRPGYYLADLRDRKYYYCGETPETVTQKFYELGIGRPDPMGKLPD
ncbi:MAG TPA: hypothetical protein V6D06_04340 [Trichocoleus sp.]